MNDDLVAITVNLESPVFGPGFQCHGALFSRLEDTFFRPWLQNDLHRPVRFIDKLKLLLNNTSAHQVLPLPVTTHPKPVHTVRTVTPSTGPSRTRSAATFLLPVIEHALSRQTRFLF